MRRHNTKKGVVLALSKADKVRLKSNLKSFCKARGVTLKAIGSKTDLHQNQFYSYMRATCRIPEPALEKIAVAMNSISRISGVNLPAISGSDLVKKRLDWGGPVETNLPEELGAPEVHESPVEVLDQAPVEAPQAFPTTIELRVTFDVESARAVAQVFAEALGTVKPAGRFLVRTSRDHLRSHQD